VSRAVITPPEEREILSNVSWETYEGMLADHRERSAPRLTYDHGTLEIMSPPVKHEELNRTIAQMVEVVAEERKINVRNLGSTTFKRDDLARGFEPDSCFYIQSASLIRGKEEIDLSIDPPPDLVIEIEISHPSLDKLPIYAQIGVKEVWRHTPRGLTILELLGDSYAAVERSRALPVLTTDIASSFIELSQTVERVEWLQRLREWIPVINMYLLIPGEIGGFAIILWGFLSTQVLLR
jgi:Uma2 family endonuclease